MSGLGLGAGFGLIGRPGSRWSAPKCVTNI